MPRSAKALLDPTLFAALGDPTRLRLVHRLSKEGPLSITALSAGSALTRQAVTKHLRLLEHARLLHSARQGRETLWQLDPRRLADARRHLDQIATQWDAALSRLRTFVEP